MSICARCIIPDSFPGVHFDEQGICNFCMQSRAEVDTPAAPELLSALLHKSRSKPYDAIVCYSGGKDSTFTLQTLVQDYGLNVLAFTFDHGFTSPQAHKNIDCVTQALGVDKEIYRPDPVVIQKIFKVSIQQLPTMPPDSIYGRGMREYGPVCYVCGCMIHSIAIRIAIRTGTHLIVTGYTPTQDPDYYKAYAARGRSAAFPTSMSAEPWLAISQIMFHFLRHWNIDAMADLFLEDVNPADVKAREFLRLFDFIRYDERKIYRRIEELGWQKPQDTDSCSTNCLLNAVGIYVYQKTMGYHPYSKQLADLIRQGLMSREEALEAVSADLDMELIHQVARSLDVTI